jgi:pimeloyl-ACP methyl ester carboxylesterase
VYVDAFAPDEGETVFQILGGSGSALDVPDPTTVLDIVGYPGGPEGDAEAFLKADTVHNYFAQDLSEADRWLIIESQRPITLSANTTGSGAPLYKTVPSWTVVGTEDKVIPPDTQRHMAERAGATVSEVAGSHVSMVSHPQASINAILDAVAAVGD